MYVTKITERFTEHNHWHTLDWKEFISNVGIYNGMFNAAKKYVEKGETVSMIFDGANEYGELLVHGTEQPGNLRTKMEFSNTRRPHPRRGWTE